MFNQALTYWRLCALVRGTGRRPLSLRFHIAHEELHEALASIDTRARDLAAHYPVAIFSQRLSRCNQRDQQFITVTGLCAGEQVFACFKL